MRFAKGAWVLAVAAAMALVVPAAAQSKPKSKTPPPAYIVPKPPEYTTGYVKSYDSASHLLTLNNGGQFRLSPMIAATQHAVGEKVKVRWVLQGRHRYADEVVVTAPAPSAAAAVQAPAVGASPDPAPSPAPQATAAAGAPTG